MQGSDSKRSAAYWARGFIILGAALGLGLSALPAAAAPFAYVSNSSEPQCVFGGAVSVIDTGAKPPAVVATVGVGTCPTGVAITPDGKHAYVANQESGTVSVIDAATNTVVATIPIVGFPITTPGAVAITPDGKHAYLTVGNGTTGIDTVSVIDTVSNKVVATVAVPQGAGAVAITPDGKHAYVTGSVVSVIATATNTVVGSPITVGTNPDAVATTPDGKSVYVANRGSNNVSVIATATNTVVATVPVGVGPAAVAVTPDGTHVYVAVGVVSVIATASNTVVTTVPVEGSALGIGITPDGTQAYVAIANGSFSNVSVIATASNTVVATIPLAGPPPERPVIPQEIGIIPDVPFAAFSPTAMIDIGTAPNTDAFVLKSSFTLGSTSNGINPPAQPVSFQIGTYAVTIPPGSFTGTVTASAFGPFTFAGTINGVSLHAAIAPTGTKRFSFQAGTQNASLTGTVNPVTARVSIGVDSGTATIHQPPASKAH